MNLTQTLMIILPTVAAYVWFIFNAESEGRISWRTNLVMGLVVIPLATCFLPVIAMQMASGGFRKRQYGVMAGAAVALLIFIGYVVLIYALGAQASVEGALER